MKKIVVFFMTISLVFCTGCFNYRDINKLLFATSVIVDIDQGNQPVLYVEAFRAIEGTESGERLIFRGRGKTVFEALRNITLGTSFKINVTQNRVLIFTQKAAEYGIDNFLDFFHRDQEFINRQYVCIYSGELEKLANIKINESKYVGMFINRLLSNVGASSRGIQININDYYKQRLVGDKISIVPIIEIRRDVGGDDKILVNGGAVVKKDKMVGAISRDQGQGFNFLLNNINSGTLEIANPDFPGSFITLEILKTKTKTDIAYEDNQIKLIKNIKVNTAIGEVQKGLNINKKSLELIKELAASNIRKACYQLFDEYKDKGIDIFDIQEEFLRKYRYEKGEDIIKQTNLVIDVEVEIETGNDDIDFINVRGE